MFVIAILAAFNDVNFLIIPIIGSVMMLAAFLYRRERVLSVLVCIIMAVCAFANTNYQMQRERSLSISVTGKDVDAVFVATEFSSGGKVIARLKHNNKSFKVYFSSAELGEVSPGDVIRANAELCSSNTNGGDFAKKLLGQNVFVRAYADRVNVSGTDFSGITGKIYKIRRFIKSSAQNVLGGEALALYQAMVIGDDSAVTKELSEKLRTAGLSHIAVVSGMHLSVILSVIIFMLRKFLGKNRYCAVVCILAAVFITLICGCGVSVVRACIMCIIYQLAQLLYRESDALSSLFLTIMVMCAYNPYVIYNAGFVLSVLATMGIIVFSKRVGSILAKVIPGKLCNVVTMCICAQITVMPYLIYSFKSFTSYGLIANALVSTFAGGIVVAGIVLPIFSGVTVISGVIAKCITGASYAVIAVCEAIQKLPKAVVNVDSPDPFMLPVWVFMLCAIIMYPQRKKDLLKLGVALFLASTVSFSTMAARRNDATIYFMENNTQSSSAVFSKQGSVLIGCSDYYEAISFAQKNADGAYDYLCVNEQNCSEAQRLVQEGRAKSVIVCAPAGGKGVQRIIECADQNNVYVVKLDFDEEYRLFENTYVSFMSFDEKYNSSGAVKLDYKGNTYISLEGMKSKEIERFCGGISCGAVRFPRLMSGVIDKLGSNFDGYIITDENKIFLKGKE